MCLFVTDIQPRLRIRVFGCARSSGRNGKIFFHTPGHNGVFPQYVFACVWSGCWDQKIFFHTPGNIKVLLQCVFTCGRSGYWQWKIVFHTPGNKRVFPQYVFSCAWSNFRNGKIFFHTLETKRFFPSTGCFTIVETKQQLLTPLSMTLFIFLFPDCHREIVNLSIYSTKNSLMMP